MDASARSGGVGMSPAEEVGNAFTVPALRVRAGDPAVRTCVRAGEADGGWMQCEMRASQFVSERNESLNSTTLRTSGWKLQAGAAVPVRHTPSRQYKSSVQVVSTSRQYKSSVQVVSTISTSSQYKSSEQARLRAPTRQSPLACTL